ncbi:hypothetical protein J2W30_002811 [Variovorax boronicumulans]|uniref:hypothetical protein n=1 Tax=Variovorax boronicumulans TaxID=436515 RepID=UPI0027849150|nr:hypothetical protein [Variovorax boronicumulans]MDQ0035046.1 hypothetical protein [Variovorax boronicumulans]
MTSTLPSPSAGPTVDDLQRELLAICKGRDNYETWAKVTGQPINARINEMRRLGNHGAVLALRKQIHALKPNAALYFGWCPGEDRHRAGEEFFAALNPKPAPLNGGCGDGESASCSDERPCLPCYLDRGPCEASPKEAGS